MTLEEIAQELTRLKGLFSDLSDTIKRNQGNLDDINDRLIHTLQNEELKSLVRLLLGQINDESTSITSHHLNHIIEILDMRIQQIQRYINE